MAFNRSLLYKIEAFERKSNIKLSEEDQAEKDLCESSFYEFGKRALRSILGDSAFKDGYHQEAIAAHLEAVYDRDIRNLIMNIPFRCSKSLWTSVMFPAWVWAAKDPKETFICISYGEDLALNLALQFRSLVTSEWYQKLWGKKVNLHKGIKSKQVIRNSVGGYRLSMSAFGGATGFGGSIHIYDDINDIRRSVSEVDRKNVINVFRNVFSSRYKDPSTLCRIVVQQRTDIDDLSGNLLRNDQNEDWVHLRLPMEYEPHDHCVTVPLKALDGKTFQDWRTEEGELIWPDYLNEEELDRIKRDFLYNEIIIAGQLQQRPIPVGGGVLKVDWLQVWRWELPVFTQVYQSWDLAFKETTQGSYNACTTWGTFMLNDVENIMLISTFKMRADYPTVREMAKRLYNNPLDIYYEEVNPPRWPHREVSWVLIEDKANGSALFADFRNEGIPARKFEPAKWGTKLERLHVATGYMKTGQVWLVQDPEHREEMIQHTKNTGQMVYLFPESVDPDEEEQTAFDRESSEYHLTESSQEIVDAFINYPSEEYQDIIDTMSQVIIQLHMDGWVLGRLAERSESKYESWKADMLSFNKNYTGDNKLFS